MRLPECTRVSVHRCWVESTIPLIVVLIVHGRTRRCEVPTTTLLVLVGVLCIGVLAQHLPVLQTQVLPMCVLVSLSVAVL
mmetsp:Transcript_35003/g.75738  ORF Transcript_35003/g.75738 Transcript_35003/m.75738 type:complete len:80 (+) Transcript_35003:81-320(+)